MNWNFPGEWKPKIGFRSLSGLINNLSAIDFMELFSISRFTEIF